MTKKTRDRSDRKRKNPSEGAIREALLRLEEMSKSGKEVQAMAFGPFFTLDFAANVEKYAVEGYYTLRTEAFDMNLAPAMAETLLFHPEGGLFLQRQGFAMTIEPEEHSTEELLERYPAASKLIH